MDVIAKPPLVIGAPVLQHMKVAGEKATHLVAVWCVVIRALMEQRENRIEPTPVCIWHADTLRDALVKAEGLVERILRRVKNDTCRCKPVVSRGLLGNVEKVRLSCPVIAPDDATPLALRKHLLDRSNLFVAANCVSTDTTHGNNAQSHGLKDLKPIGLIQFSAGEPAVELSKNHRESDLRRLSCSGGRRLNSCRYKRRRLTLDLRLRSPTKGIELARPCPDTF